MKGIFQGETLSPKLFTIFIEDIVQVFNESSISPMIKADVHLLFYADDIILLAFNSIELQGGFRLESKSS